MIRAYNEIYLERARSVMAHMFEYAVYELGYTMASFFECFLTSSICLKFERGDESVIAGKSGVELAYEVLNIIPEDIVEEKNIVMRRSPEFWLGWSLAYYQWYRARRFSEIVQSISV